VHAVGVDEVATPGEVVLAEDAHDATVHLRNAALAVGDGVGVERLPPGVARQRAQLCSDDAGEARTEATAVRVGIADIDVTGETAVDHFLQRGGEIGLDRLVARGHDARRVRLAVRDVRGLPGAVDNDTGARRGVIGELAERLLGLGEAERAVGVEGIP
jgi:hypothetical protein